MRGQDHRYDDMFSYVRLEDRIPKDHPLRAIQELVDAALRDLSRAFSKIYSREGRPSIPPERLLRALLLQAFYTIRSERQLMRHAADRLGVLWYLGYDLGVPLPDHSSLTRIRERYGVDIFRRFFEKIVEQCSKPV